MTFDFSYQPGASIESMGETASRHHRLETWALAGANGDSVVVDAYLPDRIERVVVMAHGADNSRKARYIEVSGKTFTRRATAVIALDAPLHGDREDARVLTEPVGTMASLLVQWVRDHRRLLDVIESRWPDVPIGFAGFSMGGLFGVPLMAVDERVRAAAIVIAGSTRVSYPVRFGRLDKTTRQRIAVTDPAVHASRVGDRPVMLLNADDDELVPREAALALYDAFPGPKEMVFMPGTHTEWGHAARWFRRIERFFLETLG